MKCHIGINRFATALGRSTMSRIFVADRTKKSRFLFNLNKKPVSDDYYENNNNNNTNNSENNNNNNTIVLHFSPRKSFDISIERLFIYLLE